MQMQMGQEVDLYKSRYVGHWWSAQKGQICHPDIALSMNRTAPPVRDRPAVKAPARKSVDVPMRKKRHEDSFVNLVLGVVDAADAVSGSVDNFQRWLHAPRPAPSPDVNVPPAKTVPPFDIQQIPDAMRGIGGPVGAALLDKWFAGELNYSPTPDDEVKGLNQNGVPYPASMIDTTSIKMSWVMKFGRARRGLDELTSRLETPKAREAIAKALFPYRKWSSILPSEQCGGDLMRLHREFQFQFVSVEGSLSQKLTQFAAQSLLHEGIPDDLTCALGSFNLSAAIAKATLNLSHNSSTATVTHISVYVKDNFTFTDKAGEASQYLGHWNRNHVAIVPAHQIAAMKNIGWVDYAVVQGDVHALDAVLYPVKNSDFRAWQRKHRQGGDFIIYSDTMSIRLEKPITVTL
ncbi:MAG: DUF6402 family protein [Polaromonas sp.]|nr:DUF6402 family protein [Polaromonas sp.]